MLNLQKNERFYKFSLKRNKIPRELIGMSQSSWILNQPDPYQVPKLLIDQEIQKVLQNISRTGQKQVEIQFAFKRQSDLNKFMKIYQQQMFQEQYDYLDNQKNNQESKFKKCKDIDEKEKEVRQLAFPSYHFVNIFMKIYEVRLRQLQIEYQYRFFIHKNKFRVYFPKGQQISSFFKNQIFQMKTKLTLYYRNDQTVIDKIKYSAYFNSLIQKKSIAAEYHKRNNGVDVAIFYSNTHQKKNIIEIVNKNLLEHMTILQLADKNLRMQTNKIIFKLLYSLLIEKIKKIQKDNDVLIQANYEVCCILVHDKHECFVDAKNQVMEAIQKTISLKLDGKNMRTLYNKVIRNHQKYPYLRVKYSHHSFYCVIDSTLLESNRKNIAFFIQLFLQYFQQFTQNSNISLFLKLSKYPSFLDFYFRVSTDKNIQILNFNQFTINEGYEISKIILGVKDIGQLNSIKTRKDLFETFLKIILKTQKVNHLIQYLNLKFDNKQDLLGFQNSSQYSTLISQSQLISQTDKSSNQDNFKQQKYQMNSQEKIQKQQINFENQPQKVPQMVYRSSSAHKYKQKQKKSKNFDIFFDYKSPQIDSQLKSFWNLDTRERKLEKLFCEKYRQFFGKLNFKVFKLSLKQKIENPSIEDLEKDKIYISTIIEKNNEICHHFIDLTEFCRISNQVKDKTFFIFYKLKDQQVFLPSFALVLI